MVMVRKPDGSARICIDFKKINATTTPLPFYMPRVEEVLEQVGKSRVISKLDLSKGYYQVPTKENLQEMGSLNLVSITIYIKKTKF